MYVFSFYALPGAGAEDHHLLICLTLEGETSSHGHRAGWDHNLERTTGPTPLPCDLPNMPSVWRILRIKVGLMWTDVGVSWLCLPMDWDTAGLHLCPEEERVQSSSLRPSFCPPRSAKSHRRGAPTIPRALRDAGPDEPRADRWRR